MSSVKNDLEIQQDVPFQVRTWKVERISWLILALLLVAALLGVFGDGPIGESTAWDSTAKVSARFSRLSRREASATLKLGIHPTLVQSGEFQVSLNQSFVERIEIKRIDPESTRVEVSGENYIFHFAVSEAAAAGSTPLKVVFHYEASHFGKMSICLRVADVPVSGIEQFYFP